MAFTLQAMAAEARLLASPVSYEVGTSSQEEGVGDRLTLAGLGARRLREMTDLGFRIAALSAVFAVQAIDLRGVGRLGGRALELHGRVRRFIPGLVVGTPPPMAAAMATLTAAMRDGLLARSGEGAAAVARPRL